MVLSMNDVSSWIHHYDKKVGCLQSMKKNERRYEERKEKKKRKERRRREECEMPVHCFVLFFIVLFCSFHQVLFFFLFLAFILCPFSLLNVSPFFLLSFFLLSRSLLNHHHLIPWTYCSVIFLSAVHRLLDVSPLFVLVLSLSFFVLVLSLSLPFFLFFLVFSLPFPLTDPFSFFPFSLSIIVKVVSTDNKKNERGEKKRRRENQLKSEEWLFMSWSPSLSNSLLFVLLSCRSSPRMICTAF